MAEQQKPALWEVMADAYCNANNMPTSRTGMMRSGIAAELRAIADRVVPEEVEPPNAFADEEYVPMRLREDRQRIRAMLLTAADEAEGKA